MADDPDDVAQYDLDSLRRISVLRAAAEHVEMDAPGTRAFRRIQPLDLAAFD